MAQLKDLLVNGASRLIGDTLANTLQVTTINAPTSAGGTTYGAGTNGQVLLTNGSSIYWGAAAPTVTESTVSGWGFSKTTGTVTSVRVQATSPVVSSSSAASSTTLNTTISLANNYGDTKNPYASKAVHTVLAGPSSGTASGAPSFRALVADDLPAHTHNYLSNASAGSTSAPIYINNGVATAIGYTISKSVPSDAEFTDTTYTAGSGLRLNDTSFINTRIPFVAGTQTASTGSWTGVCNDITELYDGLTIAYWLPYAGSGNATLNLTINGTPTGAKNCYYSGTNRLTTHYTAGNLILLTYRSAGNVNGTNYEGWWAQSQYDSNTVSQVRWDYSTFTAGTAGVYPYTLMMMNSGGNYESIVTSSSTGTSKARNTAGFVPGRLALYYSNGTTTNGNKQTASYYSVYEAYSNADGRYSFNISTTALTVGKPLYLVGSIGTDGLFYLDATWWTQTLPTSADGKIYMYVGSVYMPATSTTDYRFNLAPYHPMWHYTNGALRLYGGDAATVTGFTIGKSVPSDAVFTDTWTPLSTSTSGYVAKAPNDTTKFLRGDASWQTLPAGSTSTTGIVKLSSATNSTSNALAATPAAVKAAYDLAASKTANTGTVTSITLTQSTGITITDSGTAITTSGTRTISLNAATTSAIGGVTLGSSVATTVSSVATTGTSTAVARADHTHKGVKTVNGSDGAVVLSTLTIGSKTYNGSSGITITAQDLGLTGAMEFKGVTTTNLSANSTTTTLTMADGTTLTNPQTGWVVLDQNDNEEYIYTNGQWQSMGFASSYALKTHIHGNINNGGVLTATEQNAASCTMVIANTAGSIINSQISFNNDAGSEAQYLSRNGSWGGIASSSNAGLLDSNDYVALQNAIDSSITTSGGGITITGSTNDFGTTSGARTIKNTGVHSISTSGNYLVVNTSGTNANITVPYATKAQQDGDGRTISSTYVLKSGDTMTGHLVIATSTPTLRVKDTGNNDLSAYLYVGSNHMDHGVYSNGYAPTSSTFTSSAGWIIRRGSDGEVHSSFKIYGAVWNDYAEYRKDNPEESILQKPGRCVRETGNGKLTLTTERLQRGCEIISDTFGFAIGKDEENGYNTPIASNGRVLAYIYEGRDAALTHIGWPVCSGPNGTVSIMTEAEERDFPSRIIGTISEVPDYEEWGSGKVKVNGRIWIRIR